MASEETKIIGAVVSAAVTIGLAVIANLITPHVDGLIKGRRPKGNKASQVEGQTPEAEPSVEEWRANNRELLSTITWSLLVYSMSLFGMWAAVYLPLSFAGGIESKYLDLSTTKLPLGGAVPRDDFTFISLVTAVLLFFPAWTVAKILAAGMEVIASFFVDVGFYLRGRLILIGMIFIAASIAGHAVYLFNIEKEYLESIGLPFVILLFGVGYAISEKK